MYSLPLASTRLRTSAAAPEPENLAVYKIPRIVEFVEELPKGPSGKILKREIVRMYTATT
ncbi:hypothetical protein [Brevibacterium aurantiacum]|uniref:hypothetical protein n=1 Tax=Brevibacterium aurantiacum TaxID=273384 RepID=UPI001867F8C5|nr:hypothetical protein [Brevibacterium aurantiacum]